MKWEWKCCFRSHFRSRFSRPFVLSSFFFPLSLIGIIFISFIPLTCSLRVISDDRNQQISNHFSLRPITRRLFSESISSVAEEWQCVDSMNTEMSSILLFYFIIYDFISPFAIVVPFFSSPRFQDKSPPIQKVTRALKRLSSDSLTHSPCMQRRKTDQKKTHCGRMWSRKSRWLLPAPKLEDDPSRSHLASAGGPRMLTFLFRQQNHDFFIMFCVRGRHTVVGSVGSFDSLIMAS